MSGRQVRKQLKPGAPEPLSVSESETSSDEVTGGAFAALAVDESSSDASSIEIAVPEPQVRKETPQAPQEQEKDLDALLANQSWDHLVQEDTLSSDPFQYDIRRCDYEAELSRQFGGERQRFRKPQLVQKRDVWPPLHATGLQCTSHDDGQEITHSKAYAQLEYQVINGFISNNPQHTLAAQERLPGHLTSLFLLSEQYRASNVQAAHDLVERGLFVSQRFLRGKLPYHYETNRIVHLLLAKHLQYVNRKGSWQSAFEIAKLLAGLDETDPLHVLGIIDFQAMMADEIEWLMALQVDYKVYPNILYTRALAHFNAQAPHALSVLEEAMANHGAIGDALLKTETDDVFALAYVKTHASLWTQDALQWLSKHRQEGTLQAPTRRLYRHILLWDMDLFKCIPEAMREETQLFDPLPENRGPYGEYLAKQLDERQAILGDNGMLSRFLSSVMQWVEGE